MPQRDLEVSCVSLLIFAKQSHFSLEAFPRDPRYINVYGHGRINVASSTSGGLEALEFVQGLVEASLYGRFVAGEL